MENDWEGAAGDAMDLIINSVEPNSGIDVIRKILDDVIDSGDMSPVGWARIGAAACVMATDWALLPHDSGRVKRMIVDLVVRKQRDYGHHNIARFGHVGLYVRMHDKVARLENLLGSGKAPENESVTDNLLDVIGYSVIGVMVAEGTFMYPLRPTVAESNA